MEKDLLKDAKAQFQAAADAENDNRIAALDDLKFARLGEQWPDAVKKQREQEGRPCLTINRLPAFIRQVVNDARQNKPAIKVHPVDDGSDPRTAEILNGLIKNIEVSSNADVAYDTAIDFAVSSGFGYIRVNTKYACEDTFDQDIVIERVANPFSVFGDPASTAADSSDWNVAFVTELVKKSDFKKQYPKSDAADFESDGRDQLDAEWFQDDTVRLAEYWTRDEVPMDILKLSDGTVVFADDFERNGDFYMVSGIQVVGTRPSKQYKVKHRLITGSEVLDERDWVGKYIPLIPVYGDEIIVEGRRVFRSLIRDAKDSQQMFNFWRTAATELVALSPKAPWVGPKGAFNTDAQKWATANVKSHAYIEYDGGVPPQRQGFAGPPAGALQEAMNAADDMKAIMGIYNDGLGNQSNAVSGVAVNARKREGDVSTYHFIDNLSRAIRHTGRVIVDLIPGVYNSARIVRTLGEDMSVRTVAINQPTEDNGISRVYDVTAGKYDVTVDTGPSYTTRREEAAVQMTEFLRVFPQSAPIIGDLMAKNLDWPGADEIAKRLHAMLPPQLLGQNPAMAQMQQQFQMQMQQTQGMIQQLQQQLAQANQAIALQERQLADKTQENALKAQAEQIDAQNAAIKAEIDRYNAETNRLKVELEAQKTALEGMKSQAQPDIVSAINQLQMQINAMQGFQN